VTSLTFEVVDARPEPYAAIPTLLLRLRIAAAEGEPVHAVALRGQIMIEPQRRRYAATEEEQLVELFGETPRWGDTLRPFLWTHVATMVPSFTGSTEIDLAVPCTYDFEVAAAKYLHALRRGEIPIVLLFSGTAFSMDAGVLRVDPVPWHEEASFRLPVATWRAVMDLYFPNCGWVRVRRDTLDALQRFKASRALLGWDEVLTQLLKEAREDPS
jgi:hypothetical protein